MAPQDATGTSPPDNIDEKSQAPKPAVDDEKTSPATPAADLPETPALPAGLPFPFDPTAAAPDPFAHLPEEEASQLRAQVDMPDGAYGFFSLFRYATPKDLFIMIVCGVLSAAAGAALPSMTIIFGGIQNIFRDFMMLESMTLGDFKRETATYALYFVYIGVGTFAATYLSNLGFIYVGERITIKLRQEYLESCLRQNIGFFDKLGAGEVTVRITADTNAIQQGISEKLGLFISSVATLLAGFLIGFITSWKLTLILTSTLFALMINTSVATKYIIKYSIPLAIGMAQAGVIAEETLSSIRLTAAFGNERRMAEQYDKHLISLQWAGLKLKAAIAFMMAVVMSLLYLNYGLGFWQGATFLRKEELDIQDVITTLMAVMTGAFNVGSIGPHFQSFIEAGGRSAKILSIIDRENPLSPRDKEAGEKPVSVQGHIRLGDVKHIYPSRPEVTVTEKLSIEFPPGRTTAIVGPSGSGKSTIINLLLRFYDPIGGTVYLDDRDLRTLDLSWLRRQMAVVGQEPIIFATSVFENIRYGLIGTEHENAAKEKQKSLVEEAAKLANAHDFITNLPEGYETNVGQRGLLLSGGQKQRIAIARAVISDPKILLLDEATSALDSASEIAIQRALEKVCEGRTSIIIAHRLSTIRDAHNIIVMSDGDIAEQGTHEELLEKRGLFYELVNSQQLASGASSTKDNITEVGQDDAVIADEKNELRQIASRLAGDNSSSDSRTPSVRDASEEKPYTNWAIMKFVLGFNKKEWHVLLAGLLICILCGLANPVQSFFFAKQMLVLARFGSEPDSWDVQDESDFWSLMYLMLGLVQFVTNAAQGLALAYCGEIAIRRIRQQTFRSLLRQDMAYFDKPENSAGALSAFLAVETSQIAAITGATMGSILIALTNIVAGIALALAFGWKLALVCFSMVPLLLAAGFFQFWLQFRFQSRAGRAYADSAAFASEYVSSMPTVASLTLEKEVAAQYSAQLSAQKRKSLISVSKSSALFAASYSTMYLCLALGFWYGSTLMATGQYTIFEFFICLMAVVFGAQSAGTFSSFFPEVIRSRYSAHQIMKVFDRQPTIDTWKKPTEASTLRDVQGRVEFRNVSFHYESRPERPVLRGVDLVIKPGQHVALVGPSGCGKSTAIALLERFYDPTQGQILIDGHDISQVDINQYRSQIALVNQQPTLYQGTIRENICMGSPDDDVSDERIIEACKDANIYEFISSLPDGLNTNCGVGGTLLSGGQKQRIAIARALLRKPRVLLLDEATSALDSESEHVVQVALDKAAKGRTTLSIAHRLSTIQHADVIYVLDQGRVAESGTHGELIGLNGRYAEMVRLQQTQ